MFNALDIKFMSHIKELIHAYANIPTHTHTLWEEKKV